MQLPPKQEVVMVAGVPPVMADKLRYFKDRNFTERVLAPAPVALEGTGPASLWSNKVEAAGTAAVPANMAAEEGGKGLRHKIEPQPTKEIEVEGAELNLSDDDLLDPADAQHLQTIRRAAALDLSDPDTLPEF